MKSRSGAGGLPRRSAAKAGSFYAGLAALALAELALPRVLKMDHAHFWFEDLPASGSMYGLAACVVIIVASKLLGKLWLTRPENYYDS